MKAEVFVNKLYEAAEKAGIKEFEIAYGRTATARLDAFEGCISNRTDNESQSLSLSVKIGKSIGSFSCEEMEEKNIPLIIQQAKENAELIDTEDENFFHDGSGDYHSVRKYQPLAEFLELDREKFLLEVEKNIYALDKRVKKVISLSLRTYDSKVILRNSLGLNLADDYQAALASVYLSAEENGVTKTASDYVLFDKEDDFNPLYFAEKVVKKALDKLAADNISSGRYRVVFENKTFADLLNTAAGIFSANSVQEKRSKLAGKLGEKTASEIVTLVDNPLLEGGYNSRSFDQEGYPAQINEVIKKGVLRTYLHNLRTAHKDGVKSTGNGSGGRGVSLSNFYIEPGSVSKAEILAAAGEGVYINDLNGMHAGYSPVSGDFSFGAEGFKIENGKLGRPLNQFTVSGNIYSLLHEITGLGDDLEFTPDGFGAPTVMVNELAISNN